jgi:DNA-binding transcriptional ArsR family regulator
MSSARQPKPTAVFAALGDETRMRLVKKLSTGRTLSITELSEGTRITRQGVTKHLRVLERAGLAHSRRVGREQLWRFDASPLEAAQRDLAVIAAQWDAALSRLKAFVEED